MKASILGGVIAAPWWLRNYRPALAYARSVSSGSLPRYTLGSHGLLMTWVRWAATIFEGLIGPCVGVLIVLLLIAYFQKKLPLKPAHRIALIACACAGIPIVAGQLMGPDNLLRHISGAVIPLAIAVGVLSEATGWVYNKKALAVTGALLHRSA